MRSAGGLHLVEQRLVLPVSRFLELRDGNESQRGRVDAIAQARRPGTVREQVAEVRVGVGRAHLHPLHAVRVVGVLGHVGFLERLREARPAGARIELVDGGEQRLARQDVDVDPGLVMVPELVAKRRLGRAALRDFVLGRRQLRLDFGFARLLVGHGISCVDVLEHDADLHAGTSALHVGELLGHLAVAHAQDIDSSHVAAGRVPVEQPADHGAVAGAEDLLGLEASAGRRLKEALPEAADRRRAHESLAVRRRQGVLEHAIGRHQAHHAVDVVAIERLVEAADDIERGLGLGLGLGHAVASRARFCQIDARPALRSHSLAMATSDSDPKDASPVTAALNRAVLDALPFADKQDFEDARRGLLAALPEIEIKNDQGRVVWTLRDYAFLADEHAPPTVNPSLWRLARLNLNHGLFQVTDRIYQIRGFDVSNMTLIEGDRGLIVVDPLMSTEVARAGLELYTQHRGRRPIVAVIYSHSHPDHYGGVRGVVDERDVSAGRVEIWAPDRFMPEVVSETVLAGTAMVRRSQFQFGPTLPRGPRGQVDTGLGKATSRGTVTLIPPTRIVKEPIETHRIDGIEIVFQLTPETEAPAEMHMFHPGLRALNLAENATHNLHNIYP